MGFKPMAFCQQYSYYAGGLLNPQGKSAVLGPFQCMFDIPFQGLIIVH